jgi:hypothetical protein
LIARRLMGQGLLTGGDHGRGGQRTTTGWILTRRRGDPVLRPARRARGTEEFDGEGLALDVPHAVGVQEADLPANPRPYVRPRFERGIECGRVERLREGR